MLWALAVFSLWIACCESAKEYRDSWKVISVAVNDGVLVFQRNSVRPASEGGEGGGRARADTDDTMNLAEDGDLELAAVDDLGMQVEMTEQREGGENGVFAAAAAAAASANDEFVINSDDDKDDETPATTENNAATADESNAAATPAEEGSSEPVSTSAADTPAPVSTPTQQTQQQVIAQPRMELNAMHAVLFVACASGILFLLFFFDLARIVTVVYGLGGSAVMAQIIFQPLYTRFSARIFGESFAAKLSANVNLPKVRDLGWKWIDVLSSASGYALGIMWIIVSFSYVQPLTVTYYWVVQDIMGVCYCILILGLIQINTIKVASILLVLVFIYDVFYVFVTPYIFGRSVMVDVASGASSSVDQAYCDKYPSESACAGSEAPLPMLLALPWIGDFRGGFSMIGLGDLVLPGLLISFAARYDASKDLVRKCSQTSNVRNGNAVVTESAAALSGETTEQSRQQYQVGRIKKALFRGYFGPLMVAYAVGLSAAYIAVWGMKKGQPALLYLVPACLGTMVFLGWKRKELSDLWTGPKIMLKANRILRLATKVPQIRSEAERAASTSLADTTSIA